LFDTTTKCNYRVKGKMQSTGGRRGVKSEKVQGKAIENHSDILIKVSVCYFKSIKYQSVSNSIIIYLPMCYFYRELHGEKLKMPRFIVLRHTLFEDYDTLLS